MRSVIVSVGNALNVLEHYPGEVFDHKMFDLRYLNLDELQRNSVDVTGYIQKICVLCFCGGKYPDLDLSMFDLVLILDEEVLPGDPNQYLQLVQTKFSNTNIKIICSGYHKNYQLDTDSIYVYPYFLQNILRYNCPQKINSVQTHDRSFDALLGGVKRHRKVIFNKLGQHTMLDACYVNLTTSAGSAAPVKTIYRTPELDDLEFGLTTPIMINQGFNGYVELDPGIRIAYIVPWAVYQKSLYSIIAETNFENNFFFTEKTAKALYAQRPFVFFGAHLQLEELRRLGFKTFDSVIDESYDLIKDNEQRFDCAFEQVAQLFRQNYHTVYEKLQPVLEHNSTHIQNRQYFLTPLNQWLNKYFQIC
jgi:hypothetical protein